MNVPPDGRVSKELLAMQAEGRPASTHAPEALLSLALQSLNDTVLNTFGIQLLLSHPETPALLKRIHRFRSRDLPGLLALAKDIARVTADIIDKAALQTVVTPAKGENWGALKSLEKLLATKIDAGLARQMLSPLFGIYDLRLADAHPVSSKIDDAFTRARVNRLQPFVFQGLDLISSCVSTLHETASALGNCRAVSPTSAVSG